MKSNTIHVRWVKLEIPIKMAIAIGYNDAKIGTQLECSLICAMHTKR